MYQDFYQLEEKPFSLSPNPRYLYLSEGHQDAYNLVRYGILENEAFTVVIGDVGTGKTTLCRAVMESLGPNVLTALILNPFLSDEDLLKVILRRYGVLSESSATAAGSRTISKNDLVSVLHRTLLNFHKLNARPILIVDEAQNLPPKTLEQIRLLSNLETSSSKLLQIILVGQPELDRLLQTPQLRQLDQRISIRFYLKALSPEDVQPYIYHRLAVAGCRRQMVFTRRALKLIYKHSRGIPRLINLICERCLMGGYALSTHRIDRRIVRQGIASLQRTTPGRKKPARTARWRGSTNRWRLSFS